MINLATFSGSKLNNNQMKNVLGGFEGVTYVSCTSTQGGPRTIAVYGIFTEDAMAAEIDAWNNSHSYGSQIVGCEVP